jgi:ABC-type transport system substrate-binding protein
VTAADLQAAIDSIAAPAGLTEDDVSRIVSSAVAAKPGLTAADLQTAVDSAVTKAVAAAIPEAPEEVVAPSGTLDVAFPELGAYQAHPNMTSFPQASIVELAALESLHGRNLDWDYYPRLMTSWSVADDQVTWTFNLRENVQFHNGWGEFTAEDFIFTLETAASEDSINPQAAAHREKFLNPKGYTKALDDHTIEVKTAKPLWDLLTSVYSPGSDPILVVSKTQVQELEKSIGLDAANSQIVGTGPWAIADSSPGEFWLFNAVTDHYLKTPYFAEMKFHEIPEEATRVANFQTRRIDVFTAVPDTIPLLANTPGTEFMAQKGAVDQHLLFYGNYYHSFDPSTCPGKPNYWGDPDKAEFAHCPAKGWDPDSPFVSANPDLDSPEWDAARKVRLAMMVAIDRQKIIDELLYGEAVATGMLAWGNQEAKPEWFHKYDPAQAKQLLAEAGYPDGFTFDLYPAVRGAPAEVEACHAIAAMWEAVGLDVNIIEIPFNTLVEGQLDRSDDAQVVCNAAPPFIEPVWLDYFIHLPDTGWSSGFDHPEYSKLVDDGYNTFDKEERWKYNLEEGQWLWDNVQSFGLWMVNQIHALGPEVGDWGEHLETGNTRRISGLEWAPRR